MRLKLAGQWIAGHPDFSELDWTGCQDAIWSPSVMGDWVDGSGHERCGFEDEGVPGFSLSFGVTRCFRSVRGAAEFMTNLHKRQANGWAHPWHGRAYVVWDNPPGGSVEMDCGECVLQLAGPVHDIDYTGTLTVVLQYILHGGVVGAQPVVVPKTDPGLPPAFDPYEDYLDLGPDDGAELPPEFTE